MSELFQRGFSFPVHMFACKDENLKFFSLQIHNLSYNRITAERVITTPWDNT